MRHATRQSFLRSGATAALLGAAPLRAASQPRVERPQLKIGLPSAGGTTIHIFFAKSAFLDANPDTLRALLRGHVAAIRLACAQKARAVEIIMDRLKFSRADAERGYDGVIGGYNERGTLPQKVMPTFWNIVGQSGIVKKPIPERRLLDPRFIRTFSQWAPPA